MKTKVTLFFAILVSLTAMAQEFINFEGINYKAVIKDNLGNVIANQTIDLQFTILQGFAQTTVYQETHSPTTDANGMVIVNIGKGTTTDDFLSIDWSEPHYLNVQIDTGSGLTDMGTTQFMAVPYAINARNAITAANVTGLEALDEGNGIGWRLKGMNPDNYGELGSAAIDLSYGSSNSETRGATGDYSVAMGYSAEASGNYATAIGYSTIASSAFSTAIGASTTASNNTSTAMGYNSIASGAISIAMGNSTTASGLGSTAMGSNTIASGHTSTAIGRFNIGGGNPTTWVATDPLFEIGNGGSDMNRTNALTVLKNGAITAPSFDLAEITDNKALITKEYADTNLSSSGLEAINETNGMGWRLKGSNSDYYGNIGSHAVDFSKSQGTSNTLGATGSTSTAMGNQTTASGSASTAMGSQTTASGSACTAMGLGTDASGNTTTAMGYNTTASGYYTTAMGEETTASGRACTSMGDLTQASGDTATAMGYGNIASGDFSTAMGYLTTAAGYSSMAIGSSNIGGGNPTAWVATDPLFEIGNGNYITPSNALTVLKNGNVGIGTNTPIAKLQVNTSDQSGKALYGEATGLYGKGLHVKVTSTHSSANAILAESGGGASYAGYFIGRIHVTGDISYTGTITDVSDRRLKENFKPINNVLEQLQNITGYTYNMKDDVTKKREYGVIAQDVQKVFPEMVSVIDDKDHLGVSYVQLIPVLLEAIKEQQKIIDNQNSKINGLSAELEQKDKESKQFDNRLKQIEMLLKASNQ